MPGRNLYLLTALPSLGELGTQPPIGMRDLLDHLADTPKPYAEVEAILLGEDLRQREALLAGEIDQAAPAVLSHDQVRDQAPLPAYLAVATDEEAGASHQLAVDRVWAAYFRRLANLGRSSTFLAEWVGHEVGLRNALAAARAKALGLDAQRYLVEPQLGRPEDDFATVMGEWSGAPSPLAGLRVLDGARWAWLGEHEAWFTFADDELDAYAARLMLLHRWQRIADAKAGAEPGPAPSGGGNGDERS
jgi:hypothetical protein